MALPKINLSGNYHRSDGGAIADCQITFILSALDSDIAEKTTLFPQELTAVTDGNGDWSIALWPNSRGIRNTWYVVTASVAGVHGFREKSTLGKIQLVDGPDVHFDDVLSVELADVPAVDFAAAQSASAANASAGIATEKAGEASASATAASDFAAAASGSANAAGNYANTASGASDKANQWASAAEDTEVEPGLYSAFHHAAKAAAMLVPGALAAALGGETIGGDLGVAGLLTVTSSTATSAIFRGNGSAGSVQFGNSVNSNYGKIYTDTAGVMGIYADVLGTGSNPSMRFYLSGASEVARFTSTGFGIGTSTPSYALDVVGAIRNTSYIYTSNIQGLASSLTLHNTDKIKFGNGGYLVQNNPNSYDISLFTGYPAAQCMTWDRSGYVGIGSNNPSNDGSSTARNLVVKGASSTGITIHAPDANNQKLVFGSPSDNDFAYLQAWYNSGSPLLRYNVASANGHHAFQINGAEIARYTLSGVGFGTSNPKQPVHAYGPNPIRFERAGVGYAELGIDNISGVGDAVVFPRTNGSGVTLKYLTSVGVSKNGIVLDELGSVGIGTTNMSTILTKFGSSFGGLAIEGAKVGMAVSDSDAASQYGGLFQNGPATYLWSYTGNILINPNNSETARFTSSGLLIGTTIAAGSEKLRVNGSVHFDGYLQAGSSTAGGGGLRLNTGNGDHALISVRDSGTAGIANLTLAPSDGGVILQTSGSTKLETTTAGVNITGGLKFAGANPHILGNDSDGYLGISSGAAVNAGANVLMYGDTHASQAGDWVFRVSSTTILKYDYSATEFNFQANDIKTTGDTTLGAVIMMAALPTSDPSNAGQLWNNSGVVTLSA